MGAHKLATTGKPRQLNASADGRGTSKSPSRVPAQPKAQQHAKSAAGAKAGCRGAESQSSSQILDFSFMELAALSDAEGVATSGAAGTACASDTATSVKLNNNRLRSLDGLVDTARVLVSASSQVKWVDLSCNDISAITVALPQAFPNLRSLNLHGNKLEHLHEVKQLSSLSGLRSITLHGNPLAQKKHYRHYVLHFLPQITMFDYSGVTKADRQAAALWAMTFRKKLNPPSDGV